MDDRPFTTNDIAQAHCVRRNAIKELETQFCLVLCKPRAYRPAKGGEKACNSRTGCVATEMLQVKIVDTRIAKFSACADTPCCI